MSELEQQGHKQNQQQPQSGNDKVARLGNGSIPRLIIEFAIPAIIGMLVNSAYNLIDALFLGQAVGEIGLAATQVAMPIMTVFLAIAMLVGAGGNALAALRLGEGKRDEAERVLGNTLFLGIVLSIVVAILASIPAVFDTLLTISSATDQVRPSAALFLRIICYGFILQCIGFGINNFIRTSGAPNRALGTMIIGAVSCIAFNFLFVMVMGMGIMGSALATICGQACSCVAVLWYFLFTKNVPLRLRLKNIVPQGALCLTIISLGVASFFVQAGAAVVSFVTNHLLVTYGAIHPLGADNALASIGLVVRVAMFAIMPLVGVSIAIQPILGFNYGARLFSRVKETLGIGIVFASVIAVGMFAIIHIWPEEIVRLFGITDGQLVDFTVFALKIQLLLLPFVGFQIVSSNYFQATGQPLKSSLLSLSRQILFLIPLLIILPQVLPQMFPGQITGLDAIYIATPVADSCSIILTAIFIFLELRKLQRKIDQQKIEQSPSNDGYILR